MSQTIYLRPDKNWALFADVSDGSPSAGDVDHDLAWLTDGRPGFPLRLTTGNADITVSKTPAAVVDLVAICHHLLPAALSVDLTATGLSDTITIPAYPLNGVPFNAWKRLPAAVTIDALTLGISQGSPADDILIGELLAGEASVLDHSLTIDSAQFSVRRYLGPASGNPLAGIPRYNRRARSRHLSGSLWCSATELAAIADWFDAQDAYPSDVPSLLIPDSDDPTDARLVTLEDYSYKKRGPAGDAMEFLADLIFNEWPRTRW